MAIRIAMDNDRLKRLQSPQITPTRAPQASPMPSSEPSGLQQIGSYVTNKAANKYGGPLVEKGFGMAEKGLAGMFTPAAAAPTAAQFAGLKAAAPIATGATTGAGIAPGMAQAILGSGSAAAPLVAQTAGMTGAGLAGTTAAGLGTGAATGAAAAGAGAGAAPMLAALGPVGMAIGAGLLMKQFGLFSKGGHVGPLYSAAGSSVDPLRKYPTSNTGFRTGDNSGSQFSDYTNTSTPPAFNLENTAPPLPSTDTNNYDTAVTDSSFPYADPLSGSFEQLNSGGGPYTVFYDAALGGPQVYHDINDLNMSQREALYYDSPAGVNAYGEIQGDASEFTMNPSMFYENPAWSGPGADRDNTSQYVKVGGGFNPTSMNSVNYDVLADIDAGGGGD